jgi:hypothetical protein
MTVLSSDQARRKSETTLHGERARLDDSRREQHDDRERDQHKMTMHAAVVVVGGICLGLTLSTLVARLVCRSSCWRNPRRFGGRATSRDRRGCVFNFGPHALDREDLELNLRR